MVRELLTISLIAACGSAQPSGTGGDDGAVDAPASHIDGDIDAGVAVGSESVLATSQLCKLLSDHDSNDPTPNDVQHRANVLGADLGIPVAHDDRVYLLFGDTIGWKGIWPVDESHPDSVGYGADTATATAIAAQPNLLCSSLRLATLPPQNSTGPKVDASIVADFAGGAMGAPSGHALGEFIHNPAGGHGNSFPFLPGDFEVPSGAFSYGDSIYIFYTTVVGNGSIDMQGSYLAKWTQPTPGAAPNYQILYAVDERFDANGALGGHYINIAAEVAGDYVYIFGTGKYRASAIHVARKRLDALATPGGFEELGTIVATAGYGETSVHYYPEIGRWMLLAEESLPTSNRIVAHFATDPAGPWTPSLTVADMGDPAFRHTYCCTTDDACDGAQMFNCDRTGFYGSYLFPSVTHDAAAHTFTVTYTLSSFSPYNVALFQTTLHE